MAGYRPIGLSSASSSTIIAGRATSYADRRRAAAARLSQTADLARRLEAAVTAPEPDVVATAEIDPDGTLRACLRALMPLAHRTEGFDVTVSLGTAHRWAAHIHRDLDGVSAELVPGPGPRLSGPRVDSAATDGSAADSAAADGSGVDGSGADGSAVGAAEPSASEAEIAAELASLLRGGEVGAR